MSVSNRFSRHFSVKRASHSKPRSTPIDHHGLFTLDDDAKKPSKDEEKKIQQLSQSLSELGYAHVPEARIEYALRAKGVNGDLQKAWDLINIFEDSVNGILRPPAPNLKLEGAENRQKVTCWIDSLLFAMFLRTSVFEALLYHDYADEPRRRLVLVLRLWVNMLRSGKLITTDITKHVQEAIAACGWPDAAQVKQQDASEAFVFLTDKLELPLLTLKTDLFHSGSEDNDDHKFVTERLLDVAVPEDAPKDGVVSLEHCLEEYFNNKVEVKRDLRRQVTLRNGLDEKQGDLHVETVEVSGEDSSPSTPRAPPRALSNLAARPLQWRERTSSIFSERRVEVLNGVEKDVQNGEDSGPRNRPRGASIRKEVLMPAWQFLNLIPWYTDQSSSVNSQIKSHFSSKRPMLGICLKRYTITKNGSPTRLGTKIDVPLEMIPPHFAVDEGEPGESVPNPGLKLVLQAVVCHRGNYVTSGHYVSLVRAGPKREDSHESFKSLTSGQRYDTSHDVWFRHDDLSAANKVTTVDIQQALEHEWPYLLFYQVLPIEGEEDETEEPPPYEASEAFSVVSEKLAKLPPTQAARPSIEVTDQSRRASVALSEESRGRPSSVLDRGRVPGRDASSIQGNISEHPSAAGTAATTPADDTKANPLANALRGPSRSAKSSRPGSDSSEKVFTRIASRLSRDKLATSETIEVTDEISVEDGPPTDKAKEKTKAPASKSKDRKSKILGGMNRHGSLARRSKTKDIERECIVM